MAESHRPCVVWGGTGQAKVVYEILLGEGAEIIHFFENNPSVESPIDGIPISYGSDGLLSFIDNLMHYNLRPADVDCIAAIGGGNGEAREIMTQLMESHGFRSRSLIHKTAIISQTAEVGRNIQLLSGSIIGPFASIGDFSIINSGANVDHDCTIGRKCHIAPQAALAGEVFVEDNSFIGINATILPRVRIGLGATVGAGAVVTKDVSAGVVVTGNPARPLVR